MVPHFDVISMVNKITDHGKFLSINETDVFRIWHHHFQSEKEHLPLVTQETEFPVSWKGERKCTPCNGLKGLAPPETGMFFWPKVLKFKGRDFLVKVYKRFGKSVILVWKNIKKC